MLKPIAISFATMALAATLNAAEPFTLSYDFDSETGSATGWSYEEAGLIHETADYFGAPATDNPDNMVLGKVSARQADVFYTPMLHLTAGEPCTIDFDFYAPGGTPELLYHVGLEVSASTAQAASDASVTVGEVPTMKSYKSWTRYSFSFTPEADGEYCFEFKTVNQYNWMGNCGTYCLDNVVISGTGQGLVGGGEEPEPEPGPEPTPGPDYPTGKEAFELEFTFDNDADFPDGTIVAPGWGYEGSVFQRNKGEYFGVQAHSGDYLLGKSTVSSTVTLFTPMMTLVGGEPCTLEFYFLAPGGTPPVVRNLGLEIKAGTGQSTAEQTIAVGEVAKAQYADWTHFTFSFTPEETGEYCFSLTTNAAFPTGCGGAFIDDVFISGYRPAEAVEQPEGPTVDDLEPNEDNLADCQELPYIENFSNEDHYDGQTYLPIGWHSTGTTVWLTANLAALPAADGEYYMIAYHSEYERDENAYTPFFNLEAGRTYTVSFQTYIQGNDYNEDGVLTVPTLRFTVGTEQDAEFHATLLTLDQRSSGWVNHTVSFTPRLSGPYTFAYMLSGPANSGIVAVDNLVITSEGFIARVEPAFSAVGLFDVMDSRFTVGEATPVQFVNRSRYADSYEWHVEGAVPETSDEEHPSFTFPATGDYTIELTATNAKGSRTTSKSYSIKVVEKGGSYLLSHYHEGEDKYYDRGAVPAYYTDVEDFVTGFNHYYYTLAQRFDLPVETELSLGQITCWISDRRYANSTGSAASQSTAPFSIVVYGADENGLIDTANELGRKDTTVGDALGSTGLGSISATPQDIVFDEPISVKGTVYVVFEFSDQLIIDAQDANLGRSYVSTTAIRHGHGLTTLYAKPYNVPADSEARVGEWCTVDKIDSSMAGIGADWNLWVSSKEEVAVALTPDGSIAFAVTTVAGGDIIVSGTHAGGMVNVCDAQGRQLISVPSSDESTRVAASQLGNGIFIVSCPEGSAKIVK